MRDKRDHELAAVLETLTALIERASPARAMRIHCALATLGSLALAKTLEGVVEGESAAEPIARKPLRLVRPGSLKRR